MGFLTNKTAIITGAGRAVLSDGRCGSIGYGIATAYAKEGANLVITGRNVQKLDAAKEELERLAGVMPAGMYMPEELPCITVSSSITKEGTMVQINFLFINFNMHLHRYLFKVLRIILPEILYIVIASYKIYFSIQPV